MPALVRLYIRSIIIGFCLAAVFTLLLIALDIANLRHLMTSSTAGLMAILLMVFFNGIVFSGVQFAIAVMSMAESGPPSGRRHRISDFWAGFRRPARVKLPARR